MVYINKDSIDREVLNAYEKLGSPKPETPEEQNKLVFEIRKICARGLMDIKLSLIRQNLITMNGKQE